MTKSMQDRYTGCLAGLAAGDALGTTLEFRSPGSFTPLDDMVGGGPFHLQAGEWTDDTSMALCLAESLVERGEFDPIDQLERYCRWYQEGYWSSNGRCFDIGGTVRQALHEFMRTRRPDSGPTSENSAGNGSLMRLAPVVMAYARHPERAIFLAGESSRTTHGAEAAVDACRYYAGLLVGAFNGISKEELLSERYSPAGSWQPAELHRAVDEVASGSFKRHQPPEIIGSGYVVRSLEAALWAFFHSSSFREGCLMAVNLGDDADTTGAVFGQIGGAYYGKSGIPQEWLSRLAMAEQIEALALHLLSLVDRV